MASGNSIQKVWVKTGVKKIGSQMFINISSNLCLFYVLLSNPIYFM